MAIGMLGKKIGMTETFEKDGTLTPVTIIEAGPCLVLQLKVPDIDGYRSVQLGFGEKREDRTKKPLLGHFKKAGVKPKRFIKEIKISDKDKYKIGREIKVDIFKEGDFVDISGTTIGKGFQGGMKKWGWSGSPASHGSMMHRRPGSSSASSFPSRVFRGHHSPGRMGGNKRTAQKLRIVKVDLENNLLMVKGAVPGHKNSYLVIRNTSKKPERVFA